MVPVLEDHDQVHLELNLECWVDVGGTRVDLREEHVQWNLKAGNRVAVSHLDVLHFGRVGLILIGFGTHKLDLNRFDLQLTRLAHDVPLEGVRVAAVDTVDLAVEPELRQLLARGRQSVGAYHEVLFLHSTAKSRVNAATLHLAVVFG